MENAKAAIAFLVVNTTDLSQSHTFPPRSPLPNLHLLVGIYQMFGFFTEIVCWYIGFFYMPYMSFKAIQTPDRKDDTHWLTSWVIFSLLTTIQTIPVLGSLIVWIPLYLEIKFAIIIYCVYFQGSEKLYKLFVQPVFKKYEKNADKLIADLPGALQATYQEVGHSAFMKDALTKGKEFVMEHGPEAYATVLAMAHKDAQEGGSGAIQSDVQTSIELNRV